MFDFGLSGPFGLASLFFIITSYNVLTRLVYIMNGAVIYSMPVVFDTHSFFFILGASSFNAQFYEAERLG